MRRFGLIVCSLSVLLVACTSNATETATTPSAIADNQSPTAAATSSNASGGDRFEPPPAGITVADAYTAVLVTVTSPPTVPFAGTDGKYHVGYNIVLQNASRTPATINKLEIVDAFGTSKVIATFTGKQIVDTTCNFGDCNRLRTLTGSAAGDAVIPSQESRQLVISYVFSSLADVPKYVMHHLFIDGAASPVTKNPVPVDYTVSPYSLSAPGPLVIGPPVKGKNWVALNGCCDPGWAHFGSSLAANGSLFSSQTFAIDWKQTNDQGAFYIGDKTKNESYVDYGSDIIAVADGTVTASLDGQDANAPGVLPAKDPVLGPKLTVENVDGNHIVVDIGGGNYAFYAHLISGSLLVKVGDKVSKGQVIAKLGNTGNANASHMHFHVMNGPSVLGSSGVPYVIDSFQYQGKVGAQQFWDADDYLTGDFFGTDRLTTPQDRTDQLPLAWSLVNFPG